MVSVIIFTKTIGKIRRNGQKYMWFGEFMILIKIKLFFLHTSNSVMQLQFCSDFCDLQNQLVGTVFYNLRHRERARWKAKPPVWMSSQQLSGTGLVKVLDLKLSGMLQGAEQ